jgi:hypothetical protein
MLGGRGATFFIPLRGSAALLKFSGRVTGEVFASQKGRGDLLHAVRLPIFLFFFAAFSLLLTFHSPLLLLHYYR